MRHGDDTMKYVSTCVHLKVAAKRQATVMTDRPDADRHGLVATQGVPQWKVSL